MNYCCRKTHIIAHNNVIYNTSRSSARVVCSKLLHTTAYIQTCWSCLLDSKSRSDKDASAMVRMSRRPAPFHPLTVSTFGVSKIVLLSTAFCTMEAYSGRLGLPGGDGDTGRECASTFLVEESSEMLDQGLRFRSAAVEHLRRSESVSG